MTVVLVATAGLSFGVKPAAAASTSTVQVEGHGWGHARGMGSYGAWGYALDYGWDSSRILNHFYGGTRSGTLSESGPANPVIDVELTAERNLAGWVAAPSGVDVPGAGRAAAWFAVRVGPGRWDLYPGASCTEAQARSANVANRAATILNQVDLLPVRATTGSITTADDLLRPCRSNRRFRGSLSLLDSQAPRLTSPFDTIDATLLINRLPVESYLKGVVPAEIGASAPLEAQKAQAVAARSFAAHPSRDRPGAAKLVDSVLDQVYRGFDVETTVTNSSVDTTAGQVRRFTSNGSMAITEYSSSSGGYTAGGAYPAVVDLGDDTFTCTGGAANIVVGETTAEGARIVRAPGCKPGSSRVQLNARHRWQASVPLSAVESSYGVGGLEQLRVDTRNGLGEWGGRVLDLTVVAASGSRATTGSDFASRFGSYGVHSRWFTIGVSRVVPGGNGVASSPDAAAVRGSARADVVVKGTDGLVYLNTWNGSSWSGYRGLGAPSSAGIRSDPAVVSWGPGRLDVFVRGVDDKLWQRFSTNGGGSWSGWFKPVGDQGILASGPDAAAWGPNRVDVFVRGVDGQLFQRTWDGVSWGGSWLARGGLLSGDPTVVSWGAGRLDVFARGGDGRLWQTFTESSSWSGWFRPAGTEPGRLAAPDGRGSGVLDAASWGPGHVSVFVRSVDNQVWETRYQGGWSPWAKSAPGDIVQGGPGAISRGTGQLDVFVWATDGSAHQYLPR